MFLGGGGGVVLLVFHLLKKFGIFLLLVLSGCIFIFSRWLKQMELAPLGLFPRDTDRKCHLIRGSPQKK